MEKLITNDSLPFLDLLLVITLVMDGFDDLLAPSRRAFSENPFANPFTTDRPHSPDPWASPFANTQQNAFDSSLDPYANPYEALGTPNSRRDAEGGENHTTTATTSQATLKAEEIPSSDPLDSAVQESDESAQSLIPRETHDSLKPSFNETATIRPSDPEFFDGLPTASSAQPQPTTLSSIPSETTQTSHENQVETNQPLENVLKSPSAGFIAHSPAPESIPRVSEFSPPMDNILDGGSGIDRSLAGLTLGGDAFGAGGSSGWGGDAITAEWSTSSEPIFPNSAAPSSSLRQAADDDSDDDKPISQTLSRIQSEDPDRAVCHPISEGYSYWCWVRILETA